jgi:uncharacterized protein YkwD
MKDRCLIALLALSAVAVDAEAGPFRRRVQPSYSPPSYAAPVTQTAYYTPAMDSAASTAGAGDGLDEVNARRTARGLRPYVRDDALTQAAKACAAFRAERGLFGHTSNDFAFLPPGASAASAGCAAYPASHGWMSCCVEDNYTYAGAAYVTGADGRRYMQLYVR